MKRSRVFNRWLLVANLGLVMGVVVLSSGRHKPPVAKADTGAAEAGEPAATETDAVPQTIVVTNQLQWAQLESEDYRTYIKRLRAIGCPEQTIRDLIIADLDKLLAPKVQAIYGRRPQVHYWDSEEEELANNQDHREWARKEREIDREKREIVQELLGTDLVRERLKVKGQQDYYERRLAFLPEDKRDAVRGVLDQYETAARDLREQANEGEPLSAEQQSDLRKLEDQRQADLAKVLSPAEREQYELWLSPSANTVRYALYGMNASEQEFQAVYQLQRGFDQKWGNDPEAIAASESTTLLAWQKDRDALDQQVRQALGDQRYADYQRGQDPVFHVLNAAVSRYQLPRESASEAYEVQRTFQQMSLSLQANTQIAAAAREQALQDMARETDLKLRQLLGNPAYRYFQQQAK